MFESTNMVVLKVTRDCNLRCTYCYVRNKDDYVGERIKFDTFKTLVDRIISDKQKSNTLNKKISIVFHGGEPLLTDVNDLFKMMQYAKENFQQNNINYGFGIQTNLTLLNKENLQLLNKFNVNVGASFDGLKKGNLSRTKLNTNKFFEKFALLEKYEIDYGLLMVVNPANIHVVKKSTDFLVKNLNVNGIKVNYAEDVNGDDCEVSGADFFKYGMMPYINEYIQTGNTYEQNMSELIKNFIFYAFANVKKTKKTNCGSKFCGGGVNIIEVEPDGRINFCGRYAENYPEAYLSDVKNDDFLRLNQIKRYSDFLLAKHEAILETHCDTCPADDICDHGCMAFHMSKYGKWGIRKNLVCDIFKPLYDYFITHQLELINAYLMNNHNKNLSTGDEIINIKNESSIFRKVTKLGYNITNDRYNIYIEKTKE